MTLAVDLALDLVILPMEELTLTLAETQRRIGGGGGRRSDGNGAGPTIFGTCVCTSRAHDRYMRVSSSTSSSLTGGRHQGAVETVRTTGRGVDGSTTVRSGVVSQAQTAAKIKIVCLLLAADRDETDWGFGFLKRDGFDGCDAAAVLVVVVVGIVINIIIGPV